MHSPIKRRRRFKSLKRILTLLAIALFLLLMGLVLDLVVFRTYFSIPTLYKGASAVLCHNSAAPSCSPTATKERIAQAATPADVVVTEHREASKVGLDILKSGGNAIDAAVGVGYALAVTYPCCGNLGGGGFMLIRQPDGQSRFIDFRETAPQRANRDMYLDQKGQVVRDLSKKGFLAAGVPGTVKGLEYALTQYGTQPRNTVMAGAIQLAKQGFTLLPADTKIFAAQTSAFSQQPNAAAIFLNQGQPYKAGQKLVQPKLANTLNKIATQGEEAFYNGDIATEMVKASDQNGGILSASDLKNYAVKEREVLRCRYQEFEVLTAPPPGGGTTLCQMLNILDDNQVAKTTDGSAQRLHWILEAMLYAYADRNTFLGDPAFVKSPLERLVSPKYAREIRQGIKPEQATPPESVYKNSPIPQGDHTTHYTIADKQGNVVSVTYTLNSPFGAGVIAGDTGFFLNNEMDDFTTKIGAGNSYGLVQGAANQIEPSKRPLSSMTPTIILKEGKVVLATGSPGGSTIPNTVLQVMLNTLVNKHPLESVSRPRVHFQGIPNVVLTEPNGLNENVVKQLWKMGYRVIPFPSWGAAETIWFNPNGQTIGLHDPRKTTGAALSSDQPKP